MPWYALYTKPRNEKKLAQRLHEKGIEVYCPLQESIRQWSDRKKKISEPVFVSYVFVHMQNYAKERIAVLETPGAVNFLFWLRKPAIVQDAEIEAIKDFLSNYKNVKFSNDLKIGDEVYINEGPLKEQEGRLIRLSGRKAVLYLKSLGVNLIAEVPVLSLTRLSA
jgi:transcription antitermination factor NusG